MGSTISGEGQLQPAITTDSGQVTQKAGTTEDVSLPDASTLASLLVGAEKATDQVSKDTTLRKGEDALSIESTNTVSTTSSTATTTQTTEDSTTGEETEEEPTAGAPASIAGKEDDEEDKDQGLDLGSYYGQQRKSGKEMADRASESGAAMSAQKALEEEAAFAASTLIGEKKAQDHEKKESKEARLAAFAKTLAQEVPNNDLNLSKNTIAQADYYFTQAAKLSDQLQDVDNPKQAKRMMNRIESNLAVGYGTLFSELIASPAKLQAALVEGGVDPSMAAMTTYAINQIQQGEIPLSGIGERKDTFISEHTTSTAQDTCISSKDLAALLGLFASKQSDVLVEAAEYSSQVSEDTAEIGTSTSEMSSSMLQDIRDQYEQKEKAEKKSKKWGKLAEIATITVQCVGIAALATFGGPAGMAMAAAMTASLVASQTGHGNFLTKQVALALEAAGVPEKDSMLYASLAISVAAAAAGGYAMGGSSLFATSTLLGGVAGFSGMMSASGGYSASADKIARVANLSDKQAMALSITLEVTGGILSMAAGIGASASKAQEAQRLAEMSDDATRLATQMSDEAAQAGTRTIQAATPSAIPSPTPAPAPVAAPAPAAAPAAAETLGASAPEAALGSVDETAATLAQATEGTVATTGTSAQTAATNSFTESWNSLSTQLKTFANEAAAILKQPSLSSWATGAMKTAALVDFGASIASGAFSIEQGLCQVKVAKAVGEIGQDEATMSQLQSISEQMLSLGSSVSTEYSSLVTNFGQSMNTYVQTVGLGGQALAEQLSES